MISVNWSKFFNVNFHRKFYFIFFLSLKIKILRTDIGFIGFVVVSGHVAVRSNSKLRPQWTGALLSSSSNLKKEEFWKTWLFSTTGGFFMPKIPVIFRRQTIRRKITVLFTQFKLYKILNKSIIMFAKISVEIQIFRDSKDQLCVFTNCMQ